MKTIWEKIKLKKNDKLLILNLPRDLEKQIKNTTYDTELIEDKYDHIVRFITNELNDVNIIVKEYEEYLNDKSKFYFAYPKKTSKHFKNKDVNCNRDSIWKKLEEINWRAIATYAFDDDWTFLRIKQV